MADSPEFKENLKKAEKKIEKVIMKWFMEDPMMMEAISMFQKVPNKNQKTVGINTKSRPPVITFNPNFINGISTERLESIMAMEGFKILLKHPTTRLCEPKHISSLSSTVTITPHSLGNILKQNGMDDFYPTPEMFGLPSEQCFEEYFRKFMDKQDETNDKIQKIWDSMSDEEKKEAIQEAMENSQQEGDEEQDGEGQGQPQGKGDDGKDQDGYQKFDSQGEAIKEYFNPNGTNNMDWGDNPILEADIKELVNNNKDRVKQWGNFTGDMFDQIVSAHTPKISWKEVVRRFNTSVLSMRSYASRMKHNRRYGLRQPGYRREYDTKVIFAIDSSGSMSNEDLAEGLAVINSLCGHAEITYIMFDTEITHVEKNFKKAKSNFKVYGRGGTDFQEVVDYADKENVDGVIIFTDGYASEPTQPKRAKTMWLLHSKDAGMTPPCSWGYVAYLDRFEN